MTLTFTVYGVPAPKGSTRAFVPKGWTRAIVTEDNTKTRPWAALVKDAALKASQGAPVDGAVGLSVMFYLPRPKSLPKRVTDHLKKPDLDKLLRAVKDALTGVLWRDDSQVVQVEATKTYACDRPCAEVKVWDWRGVA